MRHLATLLCLSALVSACGSKPGEPGAPTNPSTVPSAPTPASSLTQISVGEEIAGVVDGHGVSYVYQLTAPSSGMLTARLTWEPTQDGSLELDLRTPCSHFSRHLSLGGSQSLLVRSIA